MISENELVLKMAHAKNERESTYLKECFRKKREYNAAEHERIRRLINVRHMKKWGYEIRDESHEDIGDGNFHMKSAYTPEGYYIGNPKDAYRLCAKKGIHPELADKSNSVCSIGFSKKDNKWFGWSHKAIFGFKKGSKCKKGNCHYIPANKEELIKETVKFQKDKYCKNITVEKDVKDGEGILGFKINYVYNYKVPNKKLRGKISSQFTCYPEKWGRGEWTAENLEDAKQMAIDFADSVS